MTHEQAVVFDAIDGIPIREYTLAFGKKLGLQHITYVLRISKQRICYYLDSKDIAIKITDENFTIKVKDDILAVRPYISRAKRIIISNVNSLITNKEIENELKKNNINIVSQITNIRAGYTEPGFTHIICFRRQVYIQPTDVNKLPENLQIQHNNTNYWIYLASDKRMCNKCHEEGHIALYCKNIDTHLLLKDNDQFPPTSNEQQTTSVLNSCNIDCVSASSSANTSSNTSSSPIVLPSVSESAFIEPSNSDTDEQNPCTNNLEGKITQARNSNNKSSEILLDVDIVQSVALDGSNFSSTSRPLKTYLQQKHKQKRQHSTDTNSTVSKDDSYSIDSDTDYKAVRRSNKKKMIKVRVEHTAEDIREKSKPALTYINSKDNNNKDLYPISFDTLYKFTRGFTLRVFQYMTLI